MNSIPVITTVAELQRAYRSIADKAKKSQQPIVVVSNGKPDIVIVDVKLFNDQVLRLKELEEDYLLTQGKKAMKEYKARKTIRLQKNQSLKDIL